MMKFRKSTNLEQAQRLLNCGVKESTADMSWRELIDRAQMTHEADGVTLCTLPYKEAALIYGEDGITPAWSLSALLSMLPSCIQHGKTEYYLDFAPYEDKGWGIGYFSNEGVRSIKGLTQPAYPIEACVRAIEWLYRNNYALNNTTDEKTV
ncbi:hypothetical protein EEL34_14215 [Muribaculaceae bacterium Isolate-039 (Harlan)]|uniref:hypothetical protein n=1 Tax=Muribaculum sp. TaxID=1918611 RepID=UPI000F545334|nr:hypothetical protein [Muribaculum sp.]MCX4277836.1 hypothetical protein [Muribaculum sp.]ROS83227.1 hypothetical protein EEL34_14215 [Muribaculaceae bacterium Isolate-039 (Harlan)]